MGKTKKPPPKYEKGFKKMIQNLMKLGRLTFFFSF
jgi:hypothetical protein